MQGTYDQGNRRMSIVLGVVMLAVLSITRVAHAVPGNAVEGKTLYQRLCVGCHGMDGRGGQMRAMLKVPPRDLTDPGYMATRSDEQLFTAIRAGGEAVGRSATMPAFAGQLSAENIWDTVAYIRTLVTATPSAPTQSVTTTTPAALVLARLRVLIWPEYDDPRVLVILRGEMSPRQAFPTIIKLPIPKQTEIIGAGMISETNELLLHPHEVVSGAQEDIITLNLPVPRFFIEFYIPLQASKANKRFMYNVTASYPIELLEVDIQQPTQATAFVTEPASMEQATDRQGFTHYQFAYRDLAAGETQQFTVTYTRTVAAPSVTKQQPLSAPATPEAAPRSPLSTPHIAFFTLAVVALLFTGFAWVWTQRQRRRGDPVTTSIPAQTIPDPSISLPTTLSVPRNFCSQCGNKIHPEHRFCARCGNALQG